MAKISATASKIAVASACGALIIGALLTTAPTPWALTTFGTGLGCLSGTLRSRAIGAGNIARAANASMWLSGIGLLVLAMAFAENMFIGAWAAGFSAHLLVDCLISLPATSRKDLASSAAAADGT